MKISAVIITFNEEAKIADAIRSVEWADEVLVVDSESTDRTREIAESLGARVVVEKWRGFAAQKQFATDAAANDMIFSLDADERVSPKLKEEIETIRRSGNAADVYSIPRLSIYLGREIRHGGWYPDRQIRLFDRRKAHWKDVTVHESIEPDDGAVSATLSGDILHFSVDGIAHHASMIQSRYAPLGARAMLESGRSTSPLQMALAPLASFLTGYILNFGFLDGVAGLCIAYFGAYNTFLKHALLMEMQVSKKLEDQRS